MRTFDTTIIDLAAAILSEVPDAKLVGIDKEHKVNGKSLIKIEYPETQEKILEKVQEDFNDRALLVSLYHFNNMRRLVTNQLFDRKERRNGYNGNGKTY